MFVCCVSRSTTASQTAIVDDWCEGERTQENQGERREDKDRPWAWAKILCMVTICNSFNCNTVTHLIKQQLDKTTMNSFMKATPNKPFWDLTVPEISQWIHALTPGVPNTGGMLFPVASAASNKSEEFTAKKAQGELLVRNLMTALSCASSFGSSSNGGSKMSPDAKRQKLDPNSNTAVGTGDRYKILDPSFAKSSSSNNNNNTNENTTELSPRAILSRITLGGLVNGMSGVDGGCVDTLSCIPLSDLQKSEDNNGATPSKGIDAVIDTAGNCVLKDLIKLARGLLRSISAR